MLSGESSPRQANLKLGRKSVYGCDNSTRQRATLRYVAGVHECFRLPGTKNPALAVCNHTFELLEHAGRLDCFRRPVKVSATIAACVPDRLIPIQGQSSQSRTGQGKFGCHFPKNTAVLCTMIHAKLPENGSCLARLLPAKRRIKLPTRLDRGIVANLLPDCGKDGVRCRPVQRFNILTV